jgi:hypothetical protein
MSIDTPRVYICSCSPKSFDELDLKAGKGGRDWWTIKRTAHPGNIVIIYLIGPICAFIASGIVESEVIPCPDKKSKFRDDPCVWARDIRMLPRPVPLKEAARYIPEWGFLRMPLARAEVPNKFVERFLQLLKVELPPPPPPTNGEPNMKALLEQFGQMILYGPPGTGKTREAKRVALALLTGRA